MNSTVNYYNNCAEVYFERTFNLEFDELYASFLKYIPEHGRIIDLGCGSGRDVKWFRDHGYDACGLDAADELLHIATSRLHIPVETGTIQEWIADTPYDGIWCCASLMHLSEADIRRFFSNLAHNLKTGGVLFLSVKEGIDTGKDSSGRFYMNYSKENLEQLLSEYSNLKLVELWYTEDKLERDSFKWLNAIIVYR